MKSDTFLPRTGAVLLCAFVTGCGMISTSKPGAPNGANARQSSPEAADTPSGSSSDSSAPGSSNMPVITLKNATNKAICAVHVVRGAQKLRNWYDNALPAGTRIEPQASYELAVDEGDARQVDIKAEDCDGNIVLRDYFAHTVYLAGSTFDITEKDDGDFDGGKPAGVPFKLVNKCNESVSYCIVGGGSKVTHVVSAHGEEDVQGAVGAVVHRSNANNDCNDPVHTVSASTSGSRVVLCE